MTDTSNSTDHTDSNDDGGKVVNIVGGDVQGNVLQARTINGGVTIN